MNGQYYHDQGYYPPEYDHQYAAYDEYRQDSRISPRRAQHEYQSSQRNDYQPPPTKNKPTKKQLQKQLLLNGYNDPMQYNGDIMHNDDYNTDRAQQQYEQQQYAKQKYAKQQYEQQQYEQQQYEQQQQYAHQSGKDKHKSGKDKHKSGKDKRKSKEKKQKDVVLSGRAEKKTKRSDSKSKKSLKVHSRPADPSRISRGRTRRSGKSESPVRRGRDGANNTRKQSFSQPPPRSRNQRAVMAPRDYSRYHLLETQSDLFDPRDPCCGMVHNTGRNLNYVESFGSLSESSESTYTRKKKRTKKPKGRSGRHKYNDDDWTSMGCCHPAVTNANLGMIAGGLLLIILLI